MKITRLFVAVQFVVMLLITVAIVPAHAGSFEDAEAASAAKARGDYGEAIRLFTLALESNELSRANQVVVYYNRGNAYDSKGDHDQAIFDFTRAIELNPKYALAYNNRGIAYNSKGDHDRAISDFTRAIELESKYAAAYNNRGGVYNCKVDYDRAISDLTRAIELDPMYVYAYINRGVAYKGKGDYDRAVADYRAALQLDPKMKEAEDGLKSLGALAQGSVVIVNYAYRAGQFVRNIRGTVQDPMGMWRALLPLQPPPGARGGYGLLGDDRLLGGDPGFGLRQLGRVTRQYVSFNYIYVVQPSGFERFGVQEGVFTSVNDMNDATLGWVFFDLRSKFEADLKHVVK